MVRLSIEGVLTAAFEAYRDDPVDFLVLGLLSFVVPFALAVGALIAVWGPSFLILLGSLADAADPAEALAPVFSDTGTLSAFLATFLGGLAVAALVWVVVWTVFYGAMLARARGDEATGLDIESSLRTGTRRFLPLLGVVVVVTVAFLVVLGVPAAVLLWSFVQAAGAFGANGGAAMGSAFVGAGVAVLVLLVGGIVLLVVVAGLFVAPPAVVVEDLGPGDALKRSWALTRGHKLSVLVIVLVGLVVQAVVGFAVDLVLTPFALLGGSDGTVLASLISGTVNAPIWPLLSLKAYEQLSAPPKPRPPAGGPPPTGPGATPEGGGATEAGEGGYVPLE